MAAATTSSSYPPPPPYYRLYKDYLQIRAPPLSLRRPLTALSSLRRYFTDVVLPSLEDQGVRELYPNGPSIDFKTVLRSLNRELQLHILELVDVLVERPSQYARRFEEISLIFKNLHHLLNSLRPHQYTNARATSIHILEKPDTASQASCGGHKKKKTGGTEITHGVASNFGWPPAVSIAEHVWLLTRSNSKTTLLILST